MFFSYGQIAARYGRFEARKVVLWHVTNYKRIRKLRNRPRSRLGRSNCLRPRLVSAAAGIYTGYSKAQYGQCSEECSEAPQGNNDCRHFDLPRRLLGRFLSFRMFLWFPGCHRSTFRASNRPYREAICRYEKNHIFFTLLLIWCLSFKIWLTYLLFLTDS